MGVRNLIRIQDFIHVHNDGSLSPMSASSASRSPFFLLGSCTLLPWARSPRRSCPGAAAATPGGLVPTLEVEHGGELALETI